MTRQSPTIPGGILKENAVTTWVEDISLLFLPRIVRISSYTIRAVQNAMMTGRSLVDFMQALVARLVVRGKRLAHWRVR